MDKVIVGVAKLMKKHNLHLDQLLKGAGCIGGAGLLGIMYLVHARHGVAPVAAIAASVGLSGWALLYREPRIPNYRLDASAPRDQFLRFVVLSDTHMTHEQMRVPDGDVLIHCGDFTNAGTVREAEQFADWFKAQPHAHKIIIAGNHETSFDHEWYHDQEGWKSWHKQAEPRTPLAELFGDSVHVLCHELLTLEGVRIFGSPWMPIMPHAQMGFQRNHEELERLWSPEGGAPDSPVDVLMTHSPPLDVLDKIFAGKHVGCDVIREAVKRLQPRFHLFGHVHEQYGATKIDGTNFVNAASVAVIGHRPVPTRPVVFDVPKTLRQ